MRAHCELISIPASLAHFSSWWVNLPSVNAVATLVPLETKFPLSSACIVVSVALR